jgi:hypothetical protein
VNLAQAEFIDWDRFLIMMQKYADLLAQNGWEQVRLVKAAALPGPNVEKMVVWDDTDQPEALAYHDDPGAPTGHTFLATARAFGIPFGIPFTHELAEQVGDPAVNLIAVSGKGNLVAYENCDAVEDAQFAFKIADYPVSDFVLRGYFDPHKKTGPYDYGRHVQAPFQVLPGGYLSLFDPRLGQWTTLHGSLDDERAFHAGMHRYKRAWKRLARRPREPAVAA